jgi:hypothetical protein
MDDYPGSVQFHSAGSIHAVLKLWLSQGSFLPPAVKVKPYGFLAKTFLFSIDFNGKKLFAGNLDTSPPARFSLYLSQS